MANSLATAASNATTNSASKTGCQFCGKDGLLVLPLRTGTLPKATGATELPAKHAAHLAGAALVTSTYVARVVREGYLYLLVDRKGTLSWQCYVSTAEGYLAEFPAATPPRTPPVFTCSPGTCGINASMMAIKEAVDVKSAYLLFTPDPLTVAKLNDLKSITAAEKQVGKGQMVKFSPASSLAGKEPVAPDQLADFVPEFILGKKTSAVFDNPLAKALLNSPFPLLQSPGAEREPQSVLAASAGAANHLSRMDGLVGFMQTRKAVAVVAPDPIGITQELNDHRNDALNKIDDFLARTDKEGVSNRWKFDSRQAIRELAKGFENGMVSDAMRGAVWAENNFRVHHEPTFPDDSDEMRQLKRSWNNRAVDSDRTTWPQRNPQASAQLEAALAKQRADAPGEEARAKDDARARWSKKYAPLLDAKAMDTFDTDFEAASKKAMDEATLHVADHLVWVVHQRYVDAFDFYDRCNERSGHAFEGQAALATFGMAGTQKGAEQIDKWLEMPVDERKNIYMRGMLRNQQAIETEAKKALDEAGQIAAQAATVSAINGDKMHKVLKGLIDLFRKSDSAWDEYVREGLKDGNKHRSVGLDKSKEGAALAKLSELNRSVFRRGITDLEKRAVGYFGGFIFARMGALADTLRFEELMYGMNPAGAHLDPKTKKPYLPGQQVPEHGKEVPGADVRSARDAGQTAAQEARNAGKKMMTVAQYRDLQRKQGIVFTVEEQLSRKDDLTSNYHHARIGVLLAVMEAIALAGKLHELNGKKDAISLSEYAMAAANLLAIASIGFDICYALAKSARETAKVTTGAKTNLAKGKANATTAAAKANVANTAAAHASEGAVRGAGDVVRGHFKLWAGGLGALAGLLGIYSDHLKLDKEKQGADRSGQKALLRIRLGVSYWNAGFGAAAAFSYSGPYFRRMLVTMAEDAAKRQAAALAAAQAAEWLAARVVLLRLVSWGSWTGVLLMVGEGIYVYFQPNALQDWLTRCTFRDRSKKAETFGSRNNELEEFAKARQLAGVRG